MRGFPSAGLKVSLVAGVVAVLLSRLLPHPPSWFQSLFWLALPVAVGARIAFRGWVEKPLIRLIRTMQRAPQEDFLPRAQVGSKDLLGKLGKVFNALLEQVTTRHAFHLERLKELGVIHDFSQKLASTLDLTELCRLLDQMLGERLGFREFALLIRDEAEGDVVVQVARGFADSSKVRGMRFKADEGLTGLVLQSLKSCYIPDTRKEPRYLYYKGEKLEDGSFLSIPLLFKGEIVGILNFTRAGVDSFTPQEIQFLGTIADQLAIALCNARLYSRTRELAVRDELTGLYNRRHFQTVFPLEIKRARRFHQPLALLMIDIDRFKRFNDLHGHLAGDQRLRELAGLLKSSLREVDFVGRYGGEEFVVLLPSTSKEDAGRVGEKLCQAVRAASFSEHPSQGVRRFTVSVGVAAYPEDGEGVTVILAAADQALYRAKGEGRDRVIASAA